MGLGACDRRIQEFAAKLSRCTLKLFNPADAQRAGFDQDRTRGDPGQSSVVAEPHVPGSSIVRYHAENNLGTGRGFTRRPSYECTLGGVGNTFGAIPVID